MTKKKVLSVAVNPSTGMLFVFGYNKKYHRILKKYLIWDSSILVKEGVQMSDDQIINASRDTSQFDVITIDGIRRMAEQYFDPPVLSSELFPFLLDFYSQEISRLKSQ